MSRDNKRCDAIIISATVHQGDNYIVFQSLLTSIAGFT